MNTRGWALFAATMIAVLGGPSVRAQPQPLLGGIFSGDLRVLPETSSKPATICKISGKMYAVEPRSGNNIPVTDGMEVGLGSIAATSVELRSADGKTHKVKLKFRLQVGSAVREEVVTEIKQHREYVHRVPINAHGKCVLSVHLEGEAGESFDRTATLRVGVPNNIVLPKPVAVPTGPNLNVKPVTMDTSGLSTNGPKVEGGVMTGSFHPVAAQKKIKVPDVKGMSASSARSAIMNAGLPAPALGVFPQNVPANLKGKVHDQLPAAGAEVAPNTQVKVRVYPSR